MRRIREKTKAMNWRKEFSLVPGYLLLVLWLLFTVVLVGWVVCASLSTSSEIFSDRMFSYESGLHWENYAKAWTTQKVNVYFINSMVYTLLSCVLLIFISAPAAYVLSRFKFPGNTLVQNAIAVALGIPVIMIILPLFSVVTSLHMTNTRAVIVFLYTALRTPFSVFFLLSFFQNLAVSFEEAAAIDGCSPGGTFWKIMLPLAQPGIITVTIFNFVINWNEYFMSLVFANKTAVRPVAVGLYNMIQSMQYTGDWGGMFASVVIVFVPTLVLYLFLSEKIIVGVTGGAIKG